MDDIEKRLKRIIGQLNGIQRMAADNRECGEILQQISAVKKAIDALTTELVATDLERIVPEDKRKEVRSLIQKTINL